MIGTNYQKRVTSSAFISKQKSPAQKIEDTPSAIQLLPLPHLINAVKKSSYYEIPNDQGTVYECDNHSGHLKMPPSSPGFHKSYFTDSPLLTSTLIPPPASHSNIADCQPHLLPQINTPLIHHTQSVSPAVHSSEAKIHILNCLVDCYKNLLGWVWGGESNIPNMVILKSFSFHFSQTHSSVLPITVSRSHSIPINPN